MGAPSSARRAKCPPTTGRAMNGPSAKLRGSLVFELACIWNMRVGEGDILSCLGVVEIGKSSVGRCFIDPVCEFGDEEGLGGAI